MTTTASPKQITDPDLCAAYGTLLRAGRNALGLSQIAMANALGIHRTTLLRLEQGSPPLRIGLCTSVLQVLRQAGLECDTPELENGQSPLTSTSLNIRITTDSIRKAQQAIDGTTQPDQLIQHFWGDTFTPPLQEKPLRKK
jgi:DNA-binding XRE family transcriptional regulator